MPKRKSYRRRVKSGFMGLGGTQGIIKKAAMGIGFASIAGLVLNQFAPQYAPIGKLAASFYGGGMVGAAAQFMLGGAVIPGLTGSTNGVTTSGATFE